MASIFGTDGVRGRANVDLTPELTLRLAKAGGRFFLSQTVKGANRDKILIGKDTRISGDMLEGAMVAGFTSLGLDVHLAGIIPTPAMAYLCRNEGYLGAVMISASHNPIEDNGIKFFDCRGIKLTDSEEREIELLLEKTDSLPGRAGTYFGRVTKHNRLKEKYADYLLSIFEGNLAGYKVVLDPAFGAAWELAPLVWERLGAEVFVINGQPRGELINKNCGSTDTSTLQDMVKKTGADMGFAYDGDADRVFAVDEKGNVIDGDYIMAICSREMILTNKLPGKTIVVTDYSNRGLEEAIKKVGGSIITVANGDRYVLAAMQDKGFKLGGEQSGHIIFLDYNTTGDGLLTSLLLAQIMQKRRQPLSQLAAIMEPWPQVIKNVHVKNKHWEDSAKILKIIADCNQKLAGKGRLFVRASGTEPVIRVMVEGREMNLLLSIIEKVGATIKEELNA